MAKNQRDYILKPLIKRKQTGTLEMIVPFFSFEIVPTSGDSNMDWITISYTV